MVEQAEFSAKPGASAVISTQSGDGESSWPLLSADSISVDFGGIQALSKVSIAVHSGSVVGLIGPNGAGKSTLFGVLTGFIVPSRGSVRLDGREVTQLPAFKRARLGLVSSFQHPELFRGLTVAEHLLLGYRISHERRRITTDLLGFRGWRGPSAEERDRVMYLLDALGLTSVADHECTALPTGVARLVEVGRVLAMNPRILLLDEPAAGLDDRETDELREVLETTRNIEGLAILVIEHDLEFVFDLCSFVHVLDAGGVIATGTPREVQTDESVQEAYLGVGYGSGSKTEQKI